MVLAAAAAFTGASVQSATGFGFALVLSPALFAVMDPVEAVMTLLVLGLALSLLVLFERGRPEHVDWRALAPMLLWALPGLALGAVAKEVDAVAHELVESGFGTGFEHGLGHGVGLEVHEGPRLARTAEGSLEAGNVVTVEPGLYVPG